MKLKLNILTILIPAVLFGLVAFVATINEAGTDTKHYIEFARYTIDYMDGIETFWGYPGEYALTILNKLSSLAANTILEDSNPSTILGLAKIIAILIGLVYLLESYKRKGKKWGRSSTLFLILYLTSDIFMLGFLNSLRTGLGIFFVSLFLSSIVANISTNLNPRNIPLAKKTNKSLYMPASASILALAMTSHNGVFMVIMIYLFSYTVAKVIEQTDRIIGYSKHVRVYLGVLMIASFSVSFIGGRVVRLRSIGQESASNITVLKLIFDSIVLLLLLTYYMPKEFLCIKPKLTAEKELKINCSAAFLFISSAVLLGLSVSTYGSETSNRIEQFLRITVYAAASISASKFVRRLSKYNWILICISLISVLSLINLASPAVQANLV